jgi:hypothetical protein
MSRDVEDHCWPFAYPLRLKLSCVLLTCVQREMPHLSSNVTGQLNRAFECNDEPQR